MARLACAKPCGYALSPPRFEPRDNDDLRRQRRVASVLCPESQRKPYRCSDRYDRRALRHLVFQVTRLPQQTSQFSALAQKKNLDKRAPNRRGYAYLRFRPRTIQFASNRVSPCPAVSDFACCIRGLLGGRATGSENVFIARILR